MTPAQSAWALAVLLGVAAPAHARIERVARVRYEVHLAAADRARSAPRVVVEIRGAPARLALVFPAWLPGAYELRYFGRDVREMSATTEEGRALEVTRVGPTRFLVSGHAEGAVVHVQYRTSAELLSDDGADVHADHAYLNPGAIVPKVLGLENEPHELSLMDLPASWRVVATQHLVGAARFSAESYGSLVDGPIEASPRLAIVEQRIEGALFVIALDREDARVPEVPRRLVDDLRKIVVAERALAGPLPFDRYLLLLHLSDRPTRTVALEHAAATSIIAPSDILDGDAYPDLRHMIAHEVFHAWNARRLVPAELVEWDPEVPQPSRSLWITEGLTEHVSLVALSRAGLGTTPSTLSWLGEAMSRARRAERAGISLEEQALLAFAAPSQLAPDADAYYAIGHVVSLALVAELSRRTDARVGLPELLRALLPRIGEKPRAIDTATLGKALDALAPAHAGDEPLSVLLRRWAQEPFRLDMLLGSLARAGLRVEPDPTEHHAELGLIVDGPQVEVRAIEPAGVFARAGVQLGDRLLQLDGAPVTMATIVALSRRSDERPLPLEVERLGRRLHLVLRPRASTDSALRVVLDGDGAAKKHRARLLEL